MKKLLFLLLCLSNFSVFCMNIQLYLEKYAYNVEDETKQAMKTGVEKIIKDCGFQDKSIEECEGLSKLYRNIYELGVENLLNNTTVQEYAEKVLNKSINSDGPRSLFWVVRDSTSEELWQKFKTCFYWTMWDVHNTMFKFNLNYPLQYEQKDPEFMHEMFELNENIFKYQKGSNSKEFLKEKTLQYAGCMLALYSVNRIIKDNKFDE